MSRVWMMIAGVAALAAVAITVALVLDRDRRPDGPYVFLTYEVAPADGQDMEQARDQAITAIRERLDARGVEWEHVAVLRDSASPSRLRVELGGKDVPFDQMIEVIGRSAALGIHVVVHDDPAMRELYRVVTDEKPEGITAEIDSWMGPNGDAFHDEYLVAEDRTKLEAWMATRGPTAAALGERHVAYETIAATATAGKPRFRTYLVENATIIDGSNVAKAEVSYDPNTMRPLVQLELDAAGRTAFADATAAALGRKLAIVLDGRVMSAPVVQSSITAGRVQVTMGDGDPKEQEREAFDLVSVLRVGAMPRLLLVERRDVGPSR